MFRVRQRETAGRQQQLRRKGEEIQQALVRAGAIIPPFMLGLQAFRNAVCFEVV